MSVARIIVQRRLSLALRVASALGLALTIGFGVALASEDSDDDVALVSLILALTILRSLAHLWMSRAFREPELDARRFAVAIYLLAVAAQCFAVATLATWLVPILLAWPITFAILLARRGARWLVIADPPLPAFVILRGSYWMQRTSAPLFAVSVRLQLPVCDDGGVRLTPLE
jgi:hypothetical protein